MKLKDIPRTATFAWSPGQQLPIIATGTVAGALDASFSNTTQLELFSLKSYKPETALESQPAGAVSSNARFNRLVWGIANDKSHGLIAGGMENGELNLWDPSIILEGDDAEKALVLNNTTHSGNVRGLQFNPFQNNLLASAATNGEIFIWDLSNPDKPYTPGTRSLKMEEITHLSWNNQVQHILATSSTSGYTVIWDLKSKRELVNLSYAGPSGSLTSGYGMGSINISGASGRRGVTAVAWNPDIATQIITASEDDNNPVIVMWDLRHAQAPEKVLTGHQKGILSLSWCQKDAGLLLSCGKDNRTLCWNPGTGEIIGELPPSLNWAFDVQWYPGNPDLFASASFDGKRDISDINDPFAPITSVYEPSFSLKQPPKWLRRPVGASFGFGGKLVTFRNKLPSTDAASTNKRVVSMYSIVSEPEVIQRSTELESAIEEKSLGGFCENREKQAVDEFESENWKVLHTMFNENENAREQLVKHLGFSKADVFSQISAAINAMNLNETSNVDQITSEPIDLQDTTQQHENDTSVPSSTVNNDIIQESENGVADLPSERSESVDELFSGPNISGEASDASNFFTSEVIPDAFPIKNESSFDVSNLKAFKFYPEQESEVDKLITRSIVLGDFEAAVNLCLETDRLSDAVLLAGCGGPELLQRTRKAYFERRASTVPYLRLLQSVVSDDLSDIVFNADLSEWQEIVVVLCTFARSEEFGGLCNSLGQRLEQEYKKLIEHNLTMESGTKALEYRKNAVLCYLAAGNLENVVNIWIAEQEEQERDEFELEDSAGSRYSFRARTLQSLIEKITIFRKAIDYVDSTTVQNLDSTNNEEINEQYKLAALYDKYTEYAEFLASQGQLNTALKYLNLTPLGYRTAPNGKDSLAIIKERIYHSGIDVGSTKEPLFPFPETYVGADNEIDQTTANSGTGGTTYSASQIDPNVTQEVYNQYIYDKPPVVPNVPYQPQIPPIQNVQHPPHPQHPNYNQYAPPLPYQNFPGYNQPYQDNTGLIPQLPVPNENYQNSNAPPAAEAPTAFKKGLSNWNDPPLVPSGQTVRKPIQNKVNKLPPITSPFPTSSPMQQRAYNPPPQNFVATQQNLPGTNAMQPPQNLPGNNAMLPPPPQVNRAGGPTYPSMPPQTVTQPAFYPPPPRPAQTSQPYTTERSTPPPPPVNTGYQAGGTGYVHPTSVPYSAANAGYSAPLPPPPHAAQQVGLPNQPSPVIQPARTPTPAKTPTPIDDKHPPGDRTHIPVSQKPIYDILNNELLKARHNSPPAQKRLIDDTEKRINILFDALNNEELSSSIIDSLSTLVQGYISII
ncbi:2724_t:CDS:10 [Acaulospora colombiana]|uniref:2724_t:CDS:1 n=1 Tax=Acaulospora colombiana TaxID=27376 RepID=A0ACA9KNW6_9GLOM|nr:2724_t:CDS:10 [Acaulospora colombiana]